MLSRIANSLFWMGRYLERAEHMARYLNVHFYMALDAPVSFRKEFLADSLYFMSGIPKSARLNKKVTPLELFEYLAVDINNPISIKNSVTSMRENARGTRDVISTELWEAINSFYHEVNGFNVNYLTENELFSFAEMVEKNSLIINGYMDHTLVHDEVWSLIHMGVHLERGNQVSRIMLAKVRDIELSKKLEKTGSSETFHCMALLKSTEAFDMSRLIYNSFPNLDNCLDFLILNRDFPKSIAFNLMKTRECFLKVFDENDTDKTSFDFELGKVCSYYHYLTLDEIKKDTMHFMASTTDTLNNLCAKLEKRYLTY